MTEYGANDGPLGRAPDISVGASDALLLAVSFAGFCVLACSVYRIVLSKLKTARELREEEEAGEVSYDELLARADVSTLNRAQRRARAKHIMKQQRRAGVPAAEGGEDFDAVPEDPLHHQHEHEHHHHQHHEHEHHEQPHDAAVPAFRDDTHHSTAQHLASRKERQKAAKRVELRQRKLLEEDRRREQKKAQEAASARRREKERQKALEAERDRDRRAALREEEARKRYDAWKTFLGNDNANGSDEATTSTATSTASTSSTTTSITVREWISELRKDRVAVLEDLADRFGVTEEVVRDRIQELLEERRLSGVLEMASSASSSAPASSPESSASASVPTRNERSTFVYLAPHEMSELASYARERDKITAKELALRIQEFVPPGSSPR